ncbi:hypothetical protein [Streptomyces sp. NPDC089799]|uniref:hypothetical protein n=1 Tax=Streptomyces sp. NPDC089799 TaxID=3155066 RepID=UPI0034454396
MGNSRNRGRRSGRRRALAAVGGALLASLTLTTPAGAAPEATTCKPAVKVLDSLPGPDPAEPSPWLEDTQVNGIGRLGLSVGTSHGKPAWWSGTTVHAVPLPTGYTGGRVDAVNRFGLMVGMVMSPTGPRAFRYRPGQAAVTLLPGGHYATAVNDHGRIVGYRYEGSDTVGIEWQGTTVRRVLAEPPGFDLRAVTGINNAGRIVGYGWGPADDPDGAWNTAPGIVWSGSIAAPPVLTQPPGDAYDISMPAAIDESGRLVGISAGHHDGTNSLVAWAPPYTTRTGPGTLAGRTSGSFEDISPTTRVTVGTAYDSPYDWPPEPMPPVQAQYWRGTGPVLALPRLAPTGFSAAFAVTDRDQVGGVAVDGSGIERPVIWTCAGKQAYQPAVPLRTVQRRPGAGINPHSPSAGAPETTRPRG